MANNILVKDGANANQTIKTTDNAGIHTPHYNIDSLPVAQVTGTIAHDAPFTSVNPLLIGGYASSSQPSGVNAEGDVVRAWFMGNGAQVIRLSGVSGALLGGDSTNGLDVDVTKVTPGVGATDLGKADDAARTSGDTGISMLAVRSDAGGSLVSTSGDYSPLQVDVAGNLRVTVSGAVNPGTNAANLGKARDSAAGATDTGVSMLAVRNDAGGTLADTTGDYAPLQLDANGNLRVTAITVNPGTTAAALGKAEDAVHTSGDVGVMTLGVRNDAGAVAAADGDYIPLSMDSSGSVRTAITVLSPGTGANNLGKNEDAVHSTGDVGVMSLAVRVDTPASQVSAAGDYSPLTVDSVGRLHTTMTASITSPVKLEDSAHATGDGGMAVWGVRNDADAALTGTDLDYSAIATNAAGHVKASVTAYSPVFDVTLSTDTVAYAAGDVLADSQVLTNIMRVANSTGVLTSMTVLDKADQKVAMTIYFLSANVSMGTENAAPSISDANSLEILGYVDINAADWKDLGGAAVVKPSFQPFNLKPATGTRDVYIAAVNGAGTPTFAADSLVCRLSIMQD